ncbi:hypothetical protein PspLS_10078 [Pyricularia sp. CBS 133598]|nr:hypothetical protein PspLS_10078 [Pyricularia sp. CBS 133598]
MSDSSAGDLLMSPRLYFCPYYHVLFSTPIPSTWLSRFPTMPLHVRLVLDDHHQIGAVPHMGPLIFSTISSGTGSVHGLRKLVAPMSWYDCQRMGSTFGGNSPFLTPLDLIVNLPVAIQEAGVNLTGLRILNLRLWEAAPAWARPKELKKTIQSLRVRQNAMSLVGTDVDSTIKVRGAFLTDETELAPNSPLLVHATRFFTEEVDGTGSTAVENYIRGEGRDFLLSLDVPEDTPPRHKVVIGEQGVRVVGVLVECEGALVLQVQALV